MRIIINADDCGKSQIVNEHIEQAIQRGKITSTTVMANMDDFNGAVALFRKYSDKISFGWHINLTEGEPLLKNQRLLDYGYYVEQNGLVSFNGKKYWDKRLPRDIKEGIKNELKAQYEKLRDAGIKISHADSHQHIHTSKSMLGVIPCVLNELNIFKVRCIRNYMPFSFNFLMRELWRFNFKSRVNNIVMTDYFISFKKYMDNPNLKSNGTIELMCHPGHEVDFYREEEKLLMSSDYSFGNPAQIINYYQL